MRRIVLLLIASCSLFIACGGGSDGADSAANVEATAATEAPATTAAPTTAAETTAAPATDAPTTAAGAAPEGAIEMTLAEWSLTGQSELPAGPQDFLVINAGTAKHNLVIVRGDGYESLPLETNGAVIQGDLAPEDLIGRTSTFDGGGASETLSVDLPAGNYVFFCDLAFGPNSHAGSGQRLDVTVTE